MTFQIEVEQYVAIGIYECDIKPDGKTDFKSKKQIKIFDLPRWLFENDTTKNRIDWILCRYSYLANRKKYYNTAYQYYDKKTGIDLDVKAAYSRVQSCKATLTKWKNKFEKWKKDFQPTLLIQNPEDDPDYPVFLDKYKAKEYELRLAEQDLAKELLEKQSTL